jgi:hypothetical protein
MAVRGVAEVQRLLSQAGRVLTEGASAHGCGERTATDLQVAVHNTATALLKWKVAWLDTRPS